jgi:ParB family chromosome partitioning protein
LEAFEALDQTEVPALIREVPKHDCYIMSLAENVGKRQPTTTDLVREIGVQRDRGLTHAEIGAKVDLTGSYVCMLLRLIDNGEDRLIRAVDSGQIPIAVAVEIATSDDASMQKSLVEAYTTGKLRGKALLVARRLVEERRTPGKPGTSAPRSKLKCTPDKLLRAYEKDCRRQRRLAKTARITETRLVFLANALKRLFRDENFVNLLRAEKLDSMPEYLADAVGRAS